MRQQIKQQRGFTILELLVVMAIIGILVAMGLRVFGGVREKSRDSRRKQDLVSISKSLEMYYNDLGRYPLSAGGLIMGCGTDALQACSWGDPFINSTNGTLYMSEIPQDPGGNQYYYSSDGMSFYLFAYLENEEDPQVVVNSSSEVTTFSSTTCMFRDNEWVNDSCNYVLMSTNLVDLPATVN